MRENDFSIPFPDGEEEERQDVSYGCLFCYTGKEMSIAEKIRSACPEVRAEPLRQMKYRTHNRVKTKVEELLLPGYVFFEAPSYIIPKAQFPRQNILRFLTSDDEEWRLQGEDRRFAQWVFRYDGVIGFSKAYSEGSRIKVVSGPLKDLEGKITRIDKRGRSGQVILNFNGREIAVWLGFEMIDPIVEKIEGMQE